MHSASFDSEISGKDGGEVLVAIAALVTEGRIPGKLNTKTKGGFYEGPHCPLNKTAREHKCDLSNLLCSTYENVRLEVLDLWKKNIPVCLEVLLTCSCKNDLTIKSPETYDDDFLLEKWYFSINHRRSAEPLFFNFVQLMNAIRSQLYFSQLTAWLTVQDENSSIKITDKNLHYRLTLPGETFESSQFSQSAVKHEFPLTDIGNGFTATVSFLSLPRMSTLPGFTCQKCTTKPKIKEKEEAQESLVDDRMHTVCTLKGKHRCEDFEEVENVKSNREVAIKRLCQNGKKHYPSTSRPKLTVDVHKANTYCKSDWPRQFHQSQSEKNRLNSHKNDLKVVQDKGKLLLDAIERSALKSTNERSVREGDRRCDENCVQSERKDESDTGSCDMSESDISSIKGKSKYDINVDTCDSPIPKLRHKKIRDVVNIDHAIKGIRKKLTFDDDFEICDKEENGKSEADIPSALEQAKFRKDLDNAASMVFHSRTGLPLTSSPAPVRRGKSCFDFDSSINSVSAIKSALFPTSFSTDEDSESDGSIVSPCSPETNAVPKRELSPVKYRRKGHAANLLGSFEESVLNGRLEPVSTVHGFTAELGASGSFVPKHLVVPVTVFFYTLGDNDKVSSPYLGHINLGKKGYNVPKTGTVQVTLFNPLGTVVKMFVIMYDLSDMPPNSQTFIRQRTLYMPTNYKEENAEWGPKWLRYLIHLRFISSKSGKIYLHSDIRMIIFRKSDMDTATAHGIDMSYELRSFTHMPVNPRFSPRK
ncbi:protein FAM214A [Tribolium madens]|uniref:protein FAM214A n=1 Tax=Tribolium madens TaxID=41895 RepID=UPI001CF7372A|nr:protein FAM214A [Tribolium madens]